MKQYRALVTDEKGNNQICKVIAIYWDWKGTLKSFTVLGIVTIGHFKLKKGVFVNKQKTAIASIIEE